MIIDMDRDRGRGFSNAMIILLLIYQAFAVDGVWKTTTSFSGEKSQAILSWQFNTTEDVSSFTIKKGKDDIVTSLLTSTVTPSYKYHVMKNQTTMEIKITLTVYNITTLDSGVYRCSLDLLDVYKDIHLTITDLIPTLNPVISTLMQNVKLVWEYNNHQIYPANKLIFTRQNKKIAEWTIKEGFSAEEDHFRRKPIFNKTTRQNGEIDVITLIIRDTYMFDFNKTYYCKLFSAGQNISTSELKLVVEIPEWIDPLSYVPAVLGEDATFIWRCKYSIQPHTIFIRKISETSGKVIETLGYWNGKELHRVGQYNDFERLNKTTTGEGEIIQLTLLNTTEDEYDCIYECDIIFDDGQEIVWEIKLEKLIVPEWIDPLSYVPAVLGEDATFIWQCKYSVQPRTIFIRKRRETPVKLIETLGYWYGKELHKDGNYTDLVSLNKTSTGEGEIIQLTVMKTTEDEYDCIYECDIIFEDGQEIVSEIKLEKLIDSQEIESEIKLEKLIEVSTIQHYSLTTQTNSEPTTKLYVFTSLMVVGLILGIVVYKLQKLNTKNSIEEESIKVPTPTQNDDEVDEGNRKENSTLLLCEIEVGNTVQKRTLYQDKVNKGNREEKRTLLHCEIEVGNTVQKRTLYHDEVNKGNREEKRTLLHCEIEEDEPKKYFPEILNFWEKLIADVPEKML